jgi:hypothetical protein
MTTTGNSETHRSRWLDRQPEGRMIEDAPKVEPTKPSKPSFVGFEGSGLGSSPNIAPREVISETPQTLAGYRVERVIWESEKAVVFHDEAGACWRYLYAYRQVWPVVVECRQEPGEFLAGKANTASVKQGA